MTACLKAPCRLYVHALVGPTADRLLPSVVEDGLNSIYKADFFAESSDLLKPDTVQSPTKETIDRLLKDSQSTREEHHRYVQSKDHGKNEPPSSRSDDDWEAQATTPLFRSKRAWELAQLLTIRRMLQKHLGEKPGRRSLAKFVRTREGEQVVALIVRKAKATRVGTAIADLTICGAIPPYNEVLGGKLVALLAVSPATVSEYTRRYGGQASIIASSMAGRTLKRDADLVFVSTTSLYGRHPNQYDRISMPCAVVCHGSKGRISYKCLGATKGVGTYHVSEETARHVSLLLTQSKQGQRVHSIFSEGVNPRLRKLRDGFDEPGLPADELLTHGTPRISYGVSLIENLHTYLLGIDKRPRYYLPNRHVQESSRRIASWWMERWVLRRLAREDVYRRIAQHTLVHPISHGARVGLPRSDVEQGLLFE